ncbi:MAG: hypothetical protein FD169_648 [Bacillota bacterium]|nr:MAG: hypothetical protein FD169_648 [Bacillota bacterium]MBS3949153.1 nucleotidyltransferase domain-containing protein [Peptococcaceae bacterium]
MLARIHTVEEIRTVVGKIAQRYGVQRVVLFGSYARGNATVNSDIDLRIDKGRLRGLFQLAGFQLDLQDTLNVRVDVVTTEGLDKRFLQRIMGEEVVLYEQS